MSKKSTPEIEIEDYAQHLMGGAMAECEKHVAAISIWLMLNYDPRRTPEQNYQDALREIDG